MGSDSNSGFLEKFLLEFVELGFRKFVGQDRKILDGRDAVEGCLTPEVQKFRSMHMVSCFRV